MTYSKEYAEALSRLNAPERSPLPYVPLNYGPITNHLSAANWNRIMSETRLGALPKYSINQRLYFDDCNDNKTEIDEDGNAVNVISDEKVFTYKLDPSFTFAKGARKSIAVREIKADKFPNAKELIGTTIKFRGTIINETNGSELQVDFNGNYYEYFMYEGNALDDLLSYLNSVKYKYKEEIRTKHFNNDNEQPLMNSNFDLSFNYNNGRIECIFQYGHTDRQAEAEITNASISIYTRNTKVCQYLNMAPLDEIALHVDDDAYEDGNYICVRLLSDPILTESFNYGFMTVCSDINPWTQGNVIGSSDFKSDAMNKIFPYNGKDEIKIWFMDELKKIHRLRYLSGYIDLELIVDNTDSYVMDK